MIDKDNEQEQETSRKLNLDDLDDEQIFIVKRFSRMVREVLTQVEIAIPEGRQLHSIKRLLNDSMYDTRDEFIRYFSDK